jgi:hypothetical protein
VYCCGLIVARALRALPDLAEGPAERAVLVLARDRVYGGDK